MAQRSLGVSEARRLLPQIVRTIAEEGGRVDVTVRGQPQVSIVRTADLTRHEHPARTAERLPAALGVEFVVPAEQLVSVVRELRAHLGTARPVPRPARAHSRRRR